MRRRTRKFLALLKSPGGGAIGVGLFSPLARLIGHFWHRLQDVYTAFDLWRDAGGDVPMIVAVISSPFFGPALAGAGLVYLAAFGRFEVSERTHRNIDRVGWVIVLICAILIVATFMFDEFLTQSGATKFAQYVKDQTLERRLSEEDGKKCRAAFEPVAASFQHIKVGAPADAEPTRYAMEFLKVFKIAGLDPVNGGQGDEIWPLQIRSSLITGRALGIGVAKVDAPPEGATLFQETMKKCGFDIPFVGFGGLPPNDFEFVVLGSR